MLDSFCCCSVTTAATNLSAFWLSAFSGTPRVYLSPDRGLPGPRHATNAGGTPAGEPLYAPPQKGNRSFLLAAARRLQIDILDEVPANPEVRIRKTAAAMRKGLQVSAFPKSPMIELAFVHSDKNLAAAVVNTLVDTYLEYHPRVPTR